MKKVQIRALLHLTIMVFLSPRINLRISQNGFLQLTALKAKQSHKCKGHVLQWKQHNKIKSVGPSDVTDLHFALLLVQYIRFSKITTCSWVISV